MLSAYAFVLVSLISTVCAGVWDKQSAAFHKALAPGNTFAANVVFNSRRHGLNFQDSMGGEGLVANNVFFNLNRETTDTAALNSWCRKTSCLHHLFYIHTKTNIQPRQARDKHRKR